MPFVWKKRRAIIFFIFLAVILINYYREIGRFIYPFPYRDLVFYHAAAFSVDPFLLAAVMKAESNFDPLAASPKGALGLTQIMPETGRWIAEKLGEENFRPDDLFDPQTSIKYAAWYISDLNREFCGNALLVLAAYNGGRGNVEAWLASRQITGGRIEEIPFPETRRYVKKVLFYYAVYRHLYGGR